MPGMLPSEASAAANSSFAWVYVLSICLLGEKVDWIKILAVVGCLGGVALLAISDLTASSHSANSTKTHVVFSFGILVEFGCAISQAFYFVAFRRWAIRHGKLPPVVSLLISGFEGLAHILFFWVGFIILNYSKIEPFEMPTSEQFKTLAMIATITSTGCLALMYGIALLPNPLIVSVATLVTTPAQYVADYILHPSQTRHLGALNIIGGALVVLTFAIIISRDYMLLREQDKSK